MDFIKNAINQSGQGGQSTDNNNNNNQNNQQNAQGGNQQEDYVDKAFDFASKKSGHTFDRNTSEKVTDAGRNAYEKLTGDKVNPKISN